MRTFHVVLVSTCVASFPFRASAGSVDQIVAIQSARITHLETVVTPVGSIIQTIIPEADFQKAYGTKWVVMRGQEIGQSKLCKTFKICRLPNAEGAFLRTQGPQAPQVGQRLDPVFPGHAHRLDANGGAAIKFIGNSGAGFTDLWMVDGGPSVTFNRRGANQGGTDGSGSHTSSSVPLVGSTGSVIDVTGELRPLSLTVHTFIRID